MFSYFNDRKSCRINFLYRPKLSFVNKIMYCFNFQSLFAQTHQYHKYLAQTHCYQIIVLHHLVHLDGIYVDLNDCQKQFYYSHFLTSFTSFCRHSCLFCVYFYYHFYCYFYSISIAKYRIKAQNPIHSHNFKILNNKTRLVVPASNTSLNLLYRQSDRYLIILKLN